jgi:integrase
VPQESLASSFAAYVQKARFAKNGLAFLASLHATLLDAAGAPLGTVQALLGHSSPEVTRQIYLHAIPAEQRQAVERVEKLLVGPKWTQIEEVTQRPN